MPRKNPLALSKQIADHILYSKRQLGSLTGSDAGTGKMAASCTKLCVFHPNSVPSGSAAAQDGHSFALGVTGWGPHRLPVSPCFPTSFALATPSNKGLPMRWHSHLVSFGAARHWIEDGPGDGGGWVGVEVVFYSCVFSDAHAWKGGLMEAERHASLNVSAGISLGVPRLWDRK